MSLFETIIKGLKNTSWEITNKGEGLVKVSGTIATSSELGTAGDVTSVAASITSVNLKATNTSRKTLIIFNDSANVLFVKYGATASATSFTWKLLAGEHVVIDDYNGVVDGIWDVATGSARITETT